MWFCKEMNRRQLTGHSMFKCYIVVRTQPARYRMRSWTPDRILEHFDVVEVILLVRLFQHDNQRLRC